MNFSLLLKHSRPRFWQYLAGPMLVLGAHFWKMSVSADTWTIWATAFVFCLFVGNLYVYGINDYYDGDTDKFNPKKQGYESQLEQKSGFLRHIYGVQIVFFLLCMIVMYSDGTQYCANCQTISLLQEIINRIWAMISPLYWFLWIMNIVYIYGLFYLLSWIYSAPPIRAKSVPFLDGITNLLYVIIPFCIYTQYLSLQNGSMFDIYMLPVVPLCSARLRCMAMHCFSAIPDIDADSKAGLQTTATVLGSRGSLYYCMILWCISAMLAYPLIGWYAVLGGIVYISMAIWAMRSDSWLVYTWFPYVNTAFGFGLFWWVVFM